MTHTKQLEIMSHAVVGFPNLEENHQAIDALVDAGVRRIELQVPFTDPVADGPTLVSACHQALQHGGSVQATLQLASSVSARHPQVDFLIMSYLNPLYRYGLEAFIREAAAAGIKGIIVPDWPVEAVEPLLPLLDEVGLAPVMMVTPNTPDERLQRISRAGRYLLYVVARLGVTGKTTHWGEEFNAYLARIRQFSDLPLAVGFGVRGAEDLQALADKVEVAAVCSRYIEWQSELGSLEAAARMRALRESAGL